MRITLIALHFAEYSCRLAAALARDHDVQLILSEPNLRSELENEVIDFQRIPKLTMVILPHSLSPSVFLRNWKRLIVETRHFQPDVIHMQENTKDYLVAAFPFLTRLCPIVMTVHDPKVHSGEDTREARLSRHTLYRRILRRFCDSAIVHGANLQDQMISVAPWLRGRVAAMPHGPLGPLHAVQREPEPGTLLFFGRINEYKGLRYFIEGVLLLRAKGIPVRGIVAGRGADLDRNRAAIEANDCFELHEEYVPRSKVRDLFLRAQIVVMPYTDATQSGVAAMAMGFNRPVVATRVGSIPEMVVDGRTGILVRPRDAVALAEAIESLLSDRAAYEALSSSIRSACDGWLGWDHIAGRAAEQYCIAIERRKSQS